MDTHQEQAWGAPSPTLLRLQQRRDALRRPRRTVVSMPDDRLSWRSQAEIKPASWSAWGFILFSFIYYSQAFITAFHGVQSGDASVAKIGQSDIVSTVWQASILCGLLYLFVSDPRWLLRHAAKLKLFFAICGLCIVSALWSDAPMITIRRSVTFTECIVFSVYAYDTLGLQGMLRLLRRLALFLAVCSLIIYVALPSVGREAALEYSNAMRGVFPQKNTMAECMLLTITCYCYNMIVDRRVGWRNAFAVLFLFGCIVLGRSASSALVAFVVMLVTAVMMLRRHPILRVTVIALFCWTLLAIIVLAVVAPDILFAGLGRDATLTGRVPLWVEVIHAIQKRPLLGYGYAGFFNSDSRDTQWLWMMAGWEAPDAHDGYLDIVIQIGVVGLVLYIWMWGLVIGRAWRFSADPSRLLAKWVLLAMTVNVLVNLDEGPLPFADWFTMMLPPAILTVAYWHERDVAARVQRSREAAPPLVPSRRDRLRPMPAAFQELPSAAK